MLKLHFTLLHIRLRFMQVWVILACEGLRVRLLLAAQGRFTPPPPYSVPNRSRRSDLDSSRLVLRPTSSFRLSWILEPSSSLP